MALDVHLRWHVLRTALERDFLAYIGWRSWTEKR